jgi:proteasome lid subunit RPN8/RPN11
MLIHRSGTEFEDMYWIDLDEIRVIAEETNSLVKKRIIYSNKIIKKSQSCKNIIIIHSHPDSFPPSIADFNSNYDHNYVVGIVACHNGKLYMYSANERINEDYYKLVVEGFLKIGYNEEEAQIKALENLQINFDIKFKEVTDYDCI